MLARIKNPRERGLKTVSERKTITVKNQII